MSEEDYGPVMAFGGTCHRQECSHPTPWDMAGIIVNHEDVYCSPECARDAFTTDADIDSIAIHDPQHHADRPEWFADKAIGCRVSVGGVGGARSQLDEFATVFPEYNTNE